MSYIATGGLFLSGDSAIFTNIIYNIAALPPITSAITQNAGVTTGTSTFDYELLGDKFEYWTDDKVGTFYAKIPTPSFSNQKTFIKIKNRTTKLTTASRNANFSETTGLFSFQIDVKHLPLSDYEIQVFTSNFDVEFADGLTLGGNGDIRVLTAKFKATAQGGLILGSNSLIHLRYDGNGNLALGGNAVLNVDFTSIPKAITIVDITNCKNWWCMAITTCVENLVYNEASIPAITICNDQDTIKRLLSKN